MRENFQRQLQELMSATSMVKAQGQRSVLSRAGFDTSPCTPEGARTTRNGRSRVLEARRYLYTSVMPIKFCFLPANLLLS